MHIAYNYAFIIIVMHIKRRLCI